MTRRSMQHHWQKFKGRVQLMLESVVTIPYRIADNFSWLRNTEKVAAVHSSDVDKFTSVLPVDTGNCHFCQKEISRDNLGGWVKVEGHFVPFCDTVTCIPLSVEDEDNEHQ